MISWQVDDNYQYVPLFINVIDNIDVSLLHISGQVITLQVVNNMQIISSVTGTPIIFDFTDIEISESRAFECFKETQFYRNVYLINVNELCARRITDDCPGVFKTQTVKDKFVLYHSIDFEKKPRKMIEELLTKSNSYQKNYIMENIKKYALLAHPQNKALESTKVVPTFFFNIKELFLRQPQYRIITTALASEIKKQGILPDFDLILSSSYSGSFLARSVSFILNKPIHCFVNLGPKFVAKNVIDWRIGKGRRCLLILDMICMGTEVKIAQAVMAALNSSIVACASIATYTPPADIKTISLLNKNDLKNIGYSLKILN